MRPSLSLEAGVTKQSHRPGSAVRCGSGTCWPFGCCTKHSKCDSGRAGKGRKEIKFYLFENGLAFARKKYSWQRNGPLTHSHTFAFAYTYMCVQMDNRSVQHPPSLLWKKLTFEFRFYFRPAEPTSRVHGGQSWRTCTTHRQIFISASLDARQVTHPSALPT